MLEIGFALLVIGLLVALGYASYVAGSTSTKLTDAESEIKEMNEALKTHEKVRASRPADINAVIDEL